jgi:hypothetical protein
MFANEFARRQLAEAGELVSLAEEVDPLVLRAEEAAAEGERRHVPSVDQGIDSR